MEPTWRALDTCGECAIALQDSKLWILTNKELERKSSITADADSDSGYPPLVPGDNGDVGQATRKRRMRELPRHRITEEPLRNDYRDSPTPPTI
jgi:hypothetical protein